MTYDDLVKHFGSHARARERLGVSRALLYLWKAKGIPYSSQCVIQVATKGKLKAEPAKIGRPASKTLDGAAGRVNGRGVDTDAASAPS